MLTAYSERQSRRDGSSGVKAGPLLESQREASARCEYLIETGLPLGIVIGPAGTGKSDLLRRLAANTAAASETIVFVDATGLNARELIAELAVELDIPGPAPDRITRLRGIRDRLQGGSDCGGRHVLLLDHLDAAQPDVPEMVAHLLRGAATSRGLTVIATARGLTSPGLVALQSDFGWLRIEIDPASAAEGVAAAMSLVEQAVGDVRRMSARAARETHELAHGIPRELQRVVRLAALASEVENTEIISESMVREAAIESVGQTVR